MDIIKSFTQVTLLIMFMFVEVARGHGGMLEPPMRSVAWKYGFDAPVNYDWMGLFCGGLHNFTKNNGKCGLCGDSYEGPFENDKGGIYDTGIIVRHYPADLREIEVKVELTAHHKGYFQFKLCPNNAEELTQACLDKYPLIIREGRLQGDPTRYFPPKDPKLSEIHVILPQGIICDRCVLQWTYTAGNSIDRDIQETFVNCADISIGGTLDKIPVKNQKPKVGATVVIEQRPNISQIIDQAPVDSVNEVLTALTGQPGGKVDGAVESSNSNNQNDAPGTGREVWDRQQTTPFGNGFQTTPPAWSSWNDNRDPRMFIPSPNELNTNFPDDTPGFTSDTRFTNPPQTAMADHSGFTRGWNREDRFLSQGQFGPNPLVRSFRGQLMPSFPIRNPFLFTDSPSILDHMQPNIPPPSQVSFVRSNNDEHSNRNVENILVDQGTHTSLLGSVENVAGQISKTPAKDRGSKPKYSSEPSTEFVNQMNDLRRAYPNKHEWVRADGMSSSRHAVRHSPRADTHDFTTDEIRHLVPTLPSDIGPRQDISPMDRRFRPGRNNFRENWFPGSRALMTRRRMRQMARRRSRLPRRIEVQTMAIAQHLLRKYPQLKGRVFLSRQGHLRNQFAHMMHKYARRQNWSRIK